MKRNKHTYEGMYILRTTLSEDARKKAVEKISSLIESLDGKVLKMVDWGRKKLAYEIKNCREGHYYIIYFEGYADAMQEMWHEYHLNEDLIRFFTLQIESVPEEDEITFKPLVRA